MKTIVLYHDSCPDGFGAAYAAWSILGDEATYRPVQYGQPPPMGDIDPGDRLFIVDFSYDRMTLVGLAQRCNRVVVLDHHKTAREALAGLEAPGLSITFDMEQSGAVLAWKYFHPDERVPMLLRYVQDRDLWLWNMLHSREFSAALSIEPRDFGAWDWLARHVEFSDYFDRFTERGKAILAAQRQHIELLASKAFLADVGGHQVPAVNSPLFQSEIGERLCELHYGSPFAAVFFIPEPGKEIWSLRSRGGFDVSAVAKSLGGGGHAAAAGFTRRISGEARP